MKNVYILFCLMSMLSLQAQVYETLDINQLKVEVFNGNSIFHNHITHNKAYVFPADSITGTIYLASLWVIGQNSGDTIRGFADGYQNNGEDTWPGPLTTDGSASIASPISNDFNRVWKINKTDIYDFINAFNAGTIGTTYTIPNAILTWPGNGSVGYAAQLSPYYDHNGDSIYNPIDGDYPIIKGTEMLRWIFNDNLYTHTQTDGASLGVEVQVNFYACSHVNPAHPLNRTSFLEYTITNRSSNHYNNLYIGLNVDGDIGGAKDDYIQTHVASNTLQFVNADEYDNNYDGIDGYKDNPPVQSVTLLEINPVPAGQALSGMCYFNNSFSINGTPNTLPEHFNLIQNKWKNGNPMYFGGLGIDTTLPCRYVFPGNSDPSFLSTYSINPGYTWTEFNTGSPPFVNPPDDRKGLLNSGPFSVASGEKITVTYMLVTTQENTLSLDSLLNKNIEEVELVKNDYLNHTLPCNDPGIGLEEYSNPDIHIYPNPANDFVRITTQVEIEKIEITDLHGKICRNIYFPSDLNIPVSNLSSGTYLINIFYHGYKLPTIKKLVIIHS